MGMYTFRQIKIEVPKDEKTDKVVGLIANENMFGLKEGNNVEPFYNFNEVFKESKVEIYKEIVQSKIGETDFNQMNLINILSHFSHLNLYVCDYELPDNVPETLKYPYIELLENKTIIYLCSTQKGGYWIEEENRYTKDFYDEVRSEMIELDCLFNQSGILHKIEYDEWSEVEKYIERPFKKYQNIKG